MIAVIGRQINSGLLSSKESLSALCRGVVIVLTSDSDNVNARFGVVRLG